MNLILKQLIQITLAADVTTPGPGVTTPGPDVTTGGGGGDIELLNPLGKNATPFTVIGNIMDYLLEAGAVILPLVIIYAAFQIMTAGGDEEKWKTGKRTILYAVIGYGIMLVARGLVVVISTILSGG